MSAWLWSNSENLTTAQDVFFPAQIRLFELPRTLRRWDMIDWSHSDTQTRIWVVPFREVRFFHSCPENQILAYRGSFFAGASPRCMIGAEVVAPRLLLPFWKFIDLGKSEMYDAQWNPYGIFHPWKWEIFRGTIILSTTRLELFVMNILWTGNLQKIAQKHFLQLLNREVRLSEIKSQIVPEMKSERFGQINYFFFATEDSEYDRP